jgi:hypothetical protein
MFSLMLPLNRVGSCPTYLEKRESKREKEKEIDRWRGNERNIQISI